MLRGSQLSLRHTVKEVKALTIQALSCKECIEIEVGTMAVFHF